MEMSDLTALVIRALGLVVGKIVKDELDDVADVAVYADVAVLSVKRLIATDTITSAAQALIETNELDYDTSQVTTRRVGHVLKKMRFSNGRVSRATKRGWMVSLEDVIRWANSYGLEARAITGIDIRPHYTCLLYTSPSPRDRTRSRMPSSA